MSLNQSQLNEMLCKMENVERKTYDEVNIVDDSTISAVAATNTFESSPLNFVNEGLRVGMFITVSGFSNGENNGQFKVVSVGVDSIGVDGSLVDEISGPSISINDSQNFFFGVASHRHNRGEFADMNDGNRSVRYMYNLR